MHVCGFQCHSSNGPTKQQFALLSGSGNGSISVIGIPETPHFFASQSCSFRRQLEPLSVDFKYKRDTFKLRKEEE